MTTVKHKTYRSFEEIDNDLKILRLEKEIDKITLTQQVHTALESLSFKNLVAHTWLSFLFNEKRWFNWAMEYALYFIFRGRKS